MSKNVRIHELLQYVEEGKIMEAMEEFYADDVVMEEPAYGKTVGLPANLAREQKFMDGVAEFKRFEAVPAVGEDFSVYENIMEWRTVDGQDVHMEQVAVQRWKDGKIVHERFYYNMD